MSVFTYKILVVVAIWIVTSGVSLSQSVAEKSLEIDRQYDEMILKSGGVSSRQIAAANARKIRYHAIIEEASLSPMVVADMSEQLALAKAAELAELPLKVAEYSRGILSVDPANVDAYLLLLRFHLNRREFDAAENLLADGLFKSKDPSKLSAYLGILAVAKTQIGQPNSAINYFERYLDSRYSATKKSLQVFSILDTVTQNVGVNCVMLGDRERFDAFVDKCFKRIEAIHNSENLAGLEAVSSFQLTWNIRYHLAAISLGGCCGESPRIILHYDSLIRFVHQHRSSIVDAKTVNHLLLEASRLTVGASCQWTEADIPEIESALNRLKLLIDKNDEVMPSKVDQHLSKSVEELRLHVAELSKTTRIIKSSAIIPESGAEEIVIWFDNDLKHLQSIRTKIRMIRSKGMGVLKIAFSDAAIEKDVLEYVAAFRTAGEVQDRGCMLEPMKIEKEKIQQLNNVSNPAWLACRDGKIEHVFLGSEFPKLMWALWSQLQANSMALQTLGR